MSALAKSGPVDGPSFRAQCAAYAESIWSLPPARTHIVRPIPRGELVARFFLPLDLLRPQNRTRHGQPWALAALKANVAACMAAQALPRSKPLPGRPWLGCCRFSSVEPDLMNDGFKFAIDVLCVAPPLLTKLGTIRKHRPALRLGFLRDDRPSEIDGPHYHWEPAAPREGFGVVSVYTGES